MDHVNRPEDATSSPKKRSNQHLTPKFTFFLLFVSDVACIGDKLLKERMIPEAQRLAELRHMRLSPKSRIRLPTASRRDSPLGPSISPSTSSTSSGLFTKTAPSDTWGETSCQPPTTAPFTLATPPPPPRKTKHLLPDALLHSNFHASLGSHTPRTLPRRHWCQASCTCCCPVLYTCG